VELFVAWWQQRTLLHGIEQVLVVVLFPQNRHKPGSGTVCFTVAAADIAACMRLNKFLWWSNSRRTAMGQIVGLFVARWQRRTLLHEIKQVLVVFQIDQVSDVSRHFLGKQDLFDFV
jgi:hypothetical protein